MSTHPMTDTKPITKTVFLTKHSLTAGIIKSVVEETSTPNLWVTRGGEMPGYYWSKDFSETMEGAIAKALELRSKKIASLQKQIAKLESLKFT